VEKLTLDKIIPVEVQHRLGASALKISDGCFEIGDLTAELADEWTTLVDGRREWIIPTDDYYSAIATIIGRSAATARTYESVARGVPKETRDACPEPYTFGHHKALLPKSKGNHDAHVRLAEDFAATADEFGGTIGSVDALRVWLDKDSPVPSFWRRVKKLVEIGKELVETEEVPDTIKAGIRALLVVTEPLLPKE
jgi:hypothetical protein